MLKQATDLHNVEPDLLLPGFSLRTSPPADFRVHEQLQIVKFDGEHWQASVPIVTDAAKE